MGTKVRVATLNDAAAIRAIYLPYVTETAITFETEVPTLEEFERRMASTLQKYPYLVVERDGEVLGYAYASAFRPRASYAWAVETSIYVDRDCRGGGLGRLLHDALKNTLVKQGFQSMNACITSAHEDNPYFNDNSRLFHEHMGYREVGRFDYCGYKFDCWHDVIWMELHIGNHPVPAPEIIPFDSSMLD